MTNRLNSIQVYPGPLPTNLPANLECEENHRAKAPLCKITQPSKKSCFRNTLNHKERGETQIQTNYDRLKKHTGNQLTTFRWNSFSYSASPGNASVGTAGRCQSRWAACWRWVVQWHGTLLFPYAAPGVLLKSRNVPNFTEQDAGFLQSKLHQTPSNIQSLWAEKPHEITLDWDRPACRTAADLVLFWKVKNINVNALGWSPLNIRQLCMRYDGVELSMSTRAMCKKRRINSYTNFSTIWANCHAVAVANHNS